MINITEKTNCCGCSACASICPKNCIRMKEDKEGFLYPNVDKDICVNCSLCKKVCPIINNIEEKFFKQKGYLVQIKDEKIRLESTAGGAFSAIAQYVLKKNGVVFGVQYDKDFNVIHTYIENEKDLYLYRNSKYVQSKIGNTFKQAKQFLQQNRLVCFSGTPCQIEGLKKYLQREYENLITIDIVCHAVPSPLVWHKYIQLKKNKYGNKITNILFRDKKYFGYKYSQMTLKDINNVDLEYNGVESDYMLRAFFSDICDRPSCYKCKFKKRYRVSDFTIWDCFITGLLAKELDDDKGTTRVLIHSAKGNDIFDIIKSDFRYKNICVDLLIKDVYEMFYSVKYNNNRIKFMHDINLLNEKDLFEKYFKETSKIKAQKFVRRLLNYMQIYSLVKTIKYLFKTHIYRYFNIKSK